MATPFQTYTIHYQSNASPDAFIQLFNAAGTFIAQLSFHKEGTPVPGNVLTAAGIHFIHYPLSGFRDVLQILQYEKPLSVLIDRSNGLGKIVSSFEPVGEQEGV